MKSEEKNLEELKREKMEEIMSKEESGELPGKPMAVSDDEFDQFTRKHPLVVIDFWAEWCAPCKAMGRVIKELAEEYSDSVAFGKVNVDENTQAPRKFQVSGIPTLVIFKDGEPVDKVVGMVPKKQLKQKLDSYL
ncbi:MAG: thioredoxin [Candidatus Hadarchaeia archaeon]